MWTGPKCIPVRLRHFVRMDVGEVMDLLVWSVGDQGGHERT